MIRYLYYFVTLHLILLQCISSKKLDQRIEDIYPKCFNRTEHTGIMLHNDVFDPVRGYAISPFEAPNERRNHFHRRNKNDKIKIIVLHYTAQYFDFAATVKLFTYNNSINSNGVSSHYLIPRETEAGIHNQLLQVVPEDCVAYHAGVSSWGPHSSINPISLGIEIVNDGLIEDSQLWDLFSFKQTNIVGLLVARMVNQYNVLPHNVVGHSDVAPNRKIDPGVMFPWEQLYLKYGVGAWLDEDELEEAVIIAKYNPSKPYIRAPNHKLFMYYLGLYGYDITYEVSAIKAFKAHFTANLKPFMYNEKITELEMYWIWALLAKYSPSM